MTITASARGVWPGDACSCTAGAQRDRRRRVAVRSVHARADRRRSRDPAGALLDTACPLRIGPRRSTTLARQPFTRLVPGHGAPSIGRNSTSPARLRRTGHLRRQCHSEQTCIDLWLTAQRRCRRRRAHAGTTAADYYLDPRPARRRGQDRRPSALDDAGVCGLRWPGAGVRDPQHAAASRFSSLRGSSAAPRALCRRGGAR